MTGDSRSQVKPARSRCGALILVALFAGRSSAQVTGAPPSQVRPVDLTKEVGVVLATESLADPKTLAVLESLGLEAHRRFGLTVSKGDQGADELLSSLKKERPALKIQDLTQSRRWRIRPPSDVSSEALSDWGNDVGVVFSQEVVPKTIEIHTPKGFEEIYAAKLGQAGINVQGCKTCVGTGASEGSLSASIPGSALPEANWGLVLSGSRRTGTMEEMAFDVALEVLAKHISTPDVLRLGRREADFMEVSIGPVRGQILHAGGPCEFISLIIVPKFSGNAVKVVVMANAMFRPFAEQCFTNPQLYERTGTKYQAEEEKFANRMAALMKKAILSEAWAVLHRGSSSF